MLRAGRNPMPSIDENRTQWSTYDWPEGGEEWSRSWGDPRLMWYGSIYPRIAAVTPAAHILEIAPGFGRCTQYLLGLCRRLTVVDLTEKCINTCRARFAEHSHIEYMVNDGRSLAFLDDASVDFVFSWDSLVHADADVCRAYVTQLGQKMAPGGYGFVHHSNMAAYRDPLSGEIARQSAHWRDGSMSAELFRAMCADAGLQVLSQEILAWEEGLNSDALSWFHRPVRHGGSPAETWIHENPTFPREVERLRFLSRLYSPTRPVEPTS
jgi:2-polyprenyl-3-methyl-5-hydroxy-6-metoxy-1,4-benzoquinol methylase